MFPLLFVDHQQLSTLCHMVVLKFGFWSIHGWLKKIVYSAHLINIKAHPQEKVIYDLGQLAVLESGLLRILGSPKESQLCLMSDVNTVLGLCI